MGYNLSTSRVEFLLKCSHQGSFGIGIPIHAGMMSGPGVLMQALGRLGILNPEPIGFMAFGGVGVERSLLLVGASRTIGPSPPQ